MRDVQRLMRGKIPCPETGIEIRKSVCAICDPGTQCGLDLYVKDGTIIKVAGSPEHPFNRGTLCAKGAATRQYVYHPERIKTPLKRIGPPGSDRFEAISWEEAFDTIAAAFKTVKAQYGPESVAFFAGYTKYFRPFLKRLAHSFGSPNYMSESSTCHQASVMAQKLVYGRPAAADIANSACLLVWSTNRFHSAPAVGNIIRRNKERGMKLMVVDPRNTPTTALADIHLRVRPGTDGALALAMANVIISEQLYDREFVDQHSYGFDGFAAYAADFSPEKAEGLTGVPADLIRTAARLYATAKPAAIMSSASSLVHHTNGVQNSRAIFSLIGLTGNYDVSGGNFVTSASFIHIPGRIQTREHAFTQSRPWDAMAPRIGNDRFPLWPELIDDEAQAMHLPEQIRSGVPYPVKALIGFGLNNRMWPDSRGLLDALGRLDLFVNVDVFMTDSCRHADIVLPACTSVERSELRCYGSGHIFYTSPAISPLHDSRSDVDIIYALADRLDLDDPLLKSGYEACLDWILEPSGMKLSELEQHHGVMQVKTPMPRTERKYLRDGFDTPSGKLEFTSQLLEKFAGRDGFTPLPAYTPSRHSRQAAAELAEQYPFILNSGARLPMFIHTRTYRLSWTGVLRPGHPSADINPADAAQAEIGQGDKIRIVTPEGGITVKANLTGMVLPGVVHMYHGHPEANVNQLLPADYLDPLSGYPGFKSALCRIEKCV